MSLLRRLQPFYRNRLLSSAGRAASAALLLAAGLAQPGSAPGFLPPSFQGRGAGGVRSSPPLAPQSGCGVVVNNSDNAPGSLRWTVACVLAGTTVTFDPSLAGQTIVLTGTEIAITQPIAIDGSGAPGIIVDAGNTSRVFNITASGPVTLTALTLQHGSSNVGGAVFDNVSYPLVLNSVRVLSSTVVAGTGGGLFAAGPLTLNNSDFISDTSTSNGGGVVAGSAAVVTGGRFERDTCTTGGCSGGAVFGFTSLTVSSTQFISNSSLSHGGAAYTISNTVVTGGTFQGNKCSQSGCQGGGLYASTTLTLTSTDFIGNTSTRHGGGAFAQGAALLTNGSFQGNQCTAGGCLGGGLDVSSTVTLNGTSFISNTSVTAAGGMYIFGNAVLTNGSFQGNKCTGAICAGGGLAVGGLTLNGTQFISNTSGLKGGAIVLGTATVTNGRFERNACTLAGCLGGGLDVELSASVLNSSFSGNQSAGNGGGIGLVSGAQLTLANVTLSGNMATTAGGGLMANSAAKAGLFNVTLADNQAPSGGGVWVNPAANVGISNTILSNNGFANCSGPIVSGTNNLEWPGSDCASASPGAGFTSADPLLAPLALNLPGTTLTQALLNGSPARDAGDPATCANPPVNNLDQRGVVRPIRGLPGPGPAICDIGAYEAGPPMWFVLLPLVRN